VLRDVYKSQVRFGIVFIDLIELGGCSSEHMKLLSIRGFPSICLVGASRVLFRVIRNAEEDQHLWVRITKADLDDGVDPKHPTLLKVVFGSVLGTLGAAADFLIFG